MSQITDAFRNNPKLKIWVGGGAIAAVGVVWYVRRRAASASTASTASTATDPTIDPSTGIPYADESGDYAGAGGIVSGSPYSYLSPVGAGVTTATLPTDNQTWAQQVTDLLVSEGYDPGAVTSAIGKYLSSGATGTPATLSQGETSIIQAALGYGGNPPIGVPTPIFTSNTGQTAAFNVPFVTGDPGQDAAQANDPYAAAAYKAYQANQTAGTQQTYLNAVKAYNTSIAPKTS